MSQLNRNARPRWFRALQDLTREHDFVTLRIDGRIPSDLRGTLYRVGPALFGRFGQAYSHWFDGDGAVTAVRFNSGNAEGAVRVLQTDSFKAETEAGQRLYGGFGTRVPGGWWKRLRQPLYKNAANINVLSWAGRLFALYEGAPPTEFSEEDLATLGESNLDELRLKSFSAHPHYVPERQATYNFGVNYGRETTLDLFELHDNGRCKRLATLPLAGPSMIHDFIATPQHLIFFVPPLRLRVLRQMLGLGTVAKNFTWQAKQGTEVLVVPIDRPHDVLRFTTDAFFQWHFCNAFERGSDLVVDAVTYPDCGPERLLSNLLTEPNEIRADGRMTRFVLDRAQKKLRTEAIYLNGSEFPRMAPGLVGQAYQYAYLLSTNPEAKGGSPLVEGDLTKLEVETGKVTRAQLGEGHYPSEPVFVPRPDATDEDAGYLLTLVYNADVHQSYVAIFDSQQLDAGPLARVWFEHFIPPTLHGVWV